MYSTSTKDRHQGKTLGNKQTQFKGQNLPLFQHSKENVSNVAELLVRPRIKPLQQLLHEKTHYRRNYCVANARGKRVLKFQLRKLEQRLVEFKHTSNPS